MLERCLNVNCGCILMWISWLAAVGGLWAGWRYDEAIFGQAGLACCALGVTIAILRDNAKTRRVIRAVARDDHLRSV